MDFLDPHRNTKHMIMLFSGYILIGIAVVLMTTILVYEAYGFGLNSNGAVIQNGLLFLSSQPNPANIYINGKLNSSTTNTRLTLQSGIYNFKLSIAGYRSWQRTIEIDGGQIVHFDYPLLIPNKLTTTKLKTYTADPGIASESLNKHWLIVQLPDSDSTFDLYDLTSQTKVPVEISIPSGILTTASTSESFQVVAWANDNAHLLLVHNFDGKSEYILLDVTNPSQTINLSQIFDSQTYNNLGFDNENYKQYYLYDATNKSLETDSLNSPLTPTPVLNNVLSYSPYLTNTVLYATTAGAPEGKVYIDVLVGTQNYHIKTFSSGTNYLLDMASYDGTIYVAAGAASENKVYVYQDPVSQLQNDPDQAPVPSQVLFVTNPNYLSFSDSAQFIAAEGGQQFGVYDIENGHGYNYTTKLPLDSPQVNASWMDGDRLTYVSGGKLIMFDYDGNYQQTLVPSLSQYVPFFDSNYKHVFTIAPESSTTSALTQTSLIVP